MAHTRKKDGQRKDKKNERMREGVAERHEHELAKRSTDQHDIVSYKPGSQRDDNRRPGPG